MPKLITDLEQALCSAHDMSLKEAKQTIAKMRNRVIDGEDPEEVLYEFGLEPVYVMELIVYICGAGFETVPVSQKPVGLVTFAYGLCHSQKDTSTT